MTQQQAFAKGDAQQKLGSAGFIVAVLLWVISSVLIFGVITSASNMQEELKQVGEHVVVAQAGELLLALSSVAVMIGMAGVYQSVTASAASTASGTAWTRLGFYIFIVGTALWTIGYALDVALAASLANWLAAPAAGKEAAYSVVTALSATSRGTFPMTVVIYWLALIPVGIGMVRSAVYPRWLGWAGQILGIAGLSLGIIQTFNGRESTFNLFMILYPLTMLWFLATGIWVARRAW
jgi:hypothetical protein